MGIVSYDAIIAQKAWVVLCCEYIEKEKNDDSCYTRLPNYIRSTDSERLDLASEILKRTAYLDFPPLSDEDIFLKIYILPFTSSSKSA
jgi:hypothetical protein